MLGVDRLPGNGATLEVPLLTVTGSGYEARGSFENVRLYETWAWTGRESPGPYGPWSSVTGDNLDATDHLVTYRVVLADDEPGTQRWWLFLEGVSQGGDRDYNDLVVEVLTR